MKNMGKDNSTPPKSTLKCQVKTLNQTLQEIAKDVTNNENFQGDFQNALQKILNIQQLYKDAQRILETYSESVVSVKENRIETEKCVFFYVEEFIDLSANSSYKEELGKIDSLSDETERKSIREAVADKICIESRKHIQDVLDILNQYTKLQFFIRSHKPFHCYGIDQAEKILADSHIDFIIDFY